MLKIVGAKVEIDEFISKNKINFLDNVEFEFVEMGSITDEEINSYGNFTSKEKEIIKEQYASHKQGFYPNPRCALY